MSAWLKSTTSDWDYLELRKLRERLIFPGVLVVKNPPANAGDLRDIGSIPGSGRSLGGGNGNLLQYSCLENSMDRGAWQATVHGVSESDTTEHMHKHTHTNHKIHRETKHRRVTIQESTNRMLLLLSRFSRVRLWVTP